MMGICICCLVAFDADALIDEVCSRCAKGLHLERCLLLRVMWGDDPEGPEPVGLFSESDLESLP